MEKQKIKEAIARAWSSPENEKKKLDVELAEAITEEVYLLAERDKEIVRKDNWPTSR